MIWNNFRKDDARLPTFINEREEKHYYETEATEKDYLAWYRQHNSKKYRTPSVTVDNVLFCYNREQDQLKVLLIRRNTHPFRNSWALPGGFVQPEESTDESCLRETATETGVSITSQHIEQLHTFSTPNRDPRGWIITVSYLAFIGEEPLTAGLDAKEALWFSVVRKDDMLHLVNGPNEIILNFQTGKTTAGEQLAFDHAKIISKAFLRVLNKMYHDPKVLRLLGQSFTITEARKVFAKFLGCPHQAIDHSNFKKALRAELVELGEKPVGIGRPSKIFTLKENKKK